MKLNLSITNKCNLRCRTCNIWRVYKDKPSLYQNELRLRDYERFFKKFNYWNWLSLIGGEPFLRDNLVDIIFSALKNCIGLHTVSIPSNGYLTDVITTKVLDILSDHRLPSLYISISLDGSKPIHDYLRGVEGSFERAVDTYNELRKIDDRRLKVHFEHVISKYNQGELSKIIKELRLTANDFIITIAQNAFYYNNECLKVEPEKEDLISELKWFLSQYKTRAPSDLGQLMFLKHVIKGRRIPCIAGKNSFYMNAYGEIFPCIFIPNKIGTVRDGINDQISLDPNCRCYTPCESYSALLLHMPTTILNAYF